MRTIGNILWLLCGGLFSGLGWIIAGILWCATIIGIPVGVQCFKLSKISFMPFGKEIVSHGGAVSCLVNGIWLLVTGLEMALANFVVGCVLCITIIGIPFGKQFFKIAELALAPFGKEVRDKT